MMLPQELEVFYVIPAIRRELAYNLSSMGLKQKEIASIFGVTEACVSNYFMSKRARDVKFNSEVKALIKTAAKALASNKSCFIFEVQKILKKFKECKGLCLLHEQLDNKLCGCRGCLKI